MHDPAELCEALLARLFTDAEFRARFLREPERVSREWGLDQASVAAFARADRVGLELAARSYAHKRSGRGERTRSDGSHGSRTGRNPIIR